MAAVNPCKWPSFENLGRDLYDQMRPTLRQLGAGAEELDGQATRGIRRVEEWLAAPCVATAKIDGTNLGVDSTGMIVGRNTVVEPGQNYSGIDVWELCAGHAQRAEQLRQELEAAAAEPLGRCLLYGELAINAFYDYTPAGVFRTWLCFGVVLEAAAGEEAAARTTSALQAAGYPAQAAEDKILLPPSRPLCSRLRELGVPTVASGYRPVGAGEAEWGGHDGEGDLPSFHSLRGLILSDWAQRFLMPAEGAPLGEGLVVVSLPSARLFKWKHAGEVSHVPQQLHEIVEALRGLVGTARAGLVPADFLEVFERLHRMATAPVQAAPKAAAPKKQRKPGKAEDAEALEVWASTLTKFDTLEACFERGGRAALEPQLIEQVAADLVKDHGASEADASQRANRVVRAQVGQRFAAWQRAAKQP